MVPPMDRLLLRGRVLTADRDLSMATVLVANGKIESVAEGLHEPRDVTLMIEDGDIIAPGFIDLQVNGVAGCDAASGAAAMADISRHLSRHGVTGFLPTVISRPVPDAVRFVEECRLAESPGAVILGAHVEGPFINPKHRGAHDLDCLSPPDPELVRELAEARPTLVTLAPELPGAIDAIRALTAAGVVVSAGHSGATMAQGIAGFDAGIRCGTHLFNAMSPLHHREPHLPGALLADERATIGLIADGVHVHPAMLALTVRVAGAERIAITTDLVAAAESPPGRYAIGGRESLSDGTTVRLADGTLAGSVATMDMMVRVMAGVPGVGLRRAVQMASTTPARVLGIDHAVRAGLPANLVVLTPDLKVRLTLVRGRVAHG
jgi:N-acetylglucosamine-6-phosphate deacetylase